ncbi:DUF7344 domain-containing protein [Natronococcus occultus]|uniref:DUF7344 domain-containing protein n=1 Tax=Natronococcus occultus SP4 TaxID=694430 RepID=L0K2I5_9EURY|nr:hypothetical protein [Natronococcus occultus]AGB39221.1 hypothetical protein Natoc_3494 [Natronococcus occultus SP4]
MADYRSEDTEDHVTATEQGVERPVIGGRRATIDESLSLLSNRRRRDVLYRLSEADVTSVDSLAATIAAREASVPAEQLSADDRERVRIELYHTHLPKLADRGLIEYDDRSGTVRWTAPTDVLESLLECCYELETET